MPGEDNQRVPLHSHSWAVWYGIIALGSVLVCLMAPFTLIGCLLSGQFADAAGVAVMIAAAALGLRVILRADNTVWMTRDGVEFGNEPTRIPWRSVGDATPVFYGAPGFYTLSFSDGTPDLHFIGSGRAYEALERAKANATSRLNQLR